MKLLVLTPRLPYPPAGGDKLLAYHHIRLMSAKVDRVHLLSFVENGREQEMARRLENEIPNLTVETVLLPPWRSYMNCAAGLISKTPLQVHYYRSPQYRARLRKLINAHTFDACYLQLIRMAQYAPDVSPARTILSMTDCLTLRYDRSTPFVRGRTRFTDAIERKRITDYETSVTERMDVNIVVAESDRHKLIELGARGRIEVVGLGVDTDYFASDDTEPYEPHTISFLGNLHSVPNRDAVRFIAEEIWPEVRRKKPDAKLQIIGINPPTFVKSLHGKNGMIVTGAVDDVRPWLRRSAVTVCPVRIGAGVQIKILESLALGVPVITTPVGFEGLEAGDRDGMLVADSGREIARHVLRVLADPAFRDNLGRRGRQFVVAHYSWETAGEILYRMLAG
jgi:sugar transferase (PEP-CTERM/EpsH1 system associated)